MKGAERDDSPVLITEAAVSYDDQYAARKRKYMIMMGMRIPCLILAAVFYQIWWLALLLIAISVPLPWAAVLIANNRPPRKAEKVNRFRPPAARVRELENQDHPVVEG